jgi:hypothetical protein
LANDNKGKGGERQFNGLIDVYVKTIKSDGIQGLYRGFVISAVGIFIYRYERWWVVGMVVWLLHASCKNNESYRQVFEHFRHIRFIFFGSYCTNRMRVFLFKKNAQYGIFSKSDGDKRLRRTGA